MENCHVDTSLPLSFWISCSWRLHLFPSSLCRKARDGAFVVGKRIGAGCSFHSQDNYPHCDLNDPPFSPGDLCAPRSAPQPLCARLPPPCPVSGNMKTPIMKPFWLMEKGLLEPHLPQRRLNYVSNCDNFPSIHGLSLKGKEREEKTERHWKGNYTDNVECENCYTKMTVRKV